MCKVAYMLCFFLFRTALQICKLKPSTLLKLAILMLTLCRIDLVKLLIVMTSELSRLCLVVNLNALILLCSILCWKDLTVLDQRAKIHEKGVSLTHMKGHSPGIFNGI